MEKFKESYLFPVDITTMVEGEKNKLIKMYLNTLDMKFDSLVVFDDNKKIIIKKELRQIFLDVINGFSRFARTLLINYISHSENLDTILDRINDVNDKLDKLDKLDK